jgi:hypothetical protein
MIMAHIQGILSGQQVPFSDERVERLKGQALRTSQGRSEAARQALDEDLITSGMFRSGARVRGRQDIVRNEGAQYSQTAAGILNTAETENFKARTDALDRAQKWLDDKRNYLLQKESNDIQLRVGLAQIQLGYARIKAERDMLTQQLAARGGGGSGPSDTDLIRRLINGIPPAPSPSPN